MVVKPSSIFVQVLRELFRQVSTPSGGEAGGDGHVIDDVTVIPGHLFVSTVPKQTTLTDQINEGTCTSLVRIIPTLVHTGI